MTLKDTCKLVKFLQFRNICNNHFVSFHDTYLFIEFTLMSFSVLAVLDEDEQTLINVNIVDKEKVRYLYVSKAVNISLKSFIPDSFLPSGHIRVENDYCCTSTSWQNRCLSEAWEIIMRRSPLNRNGLYLPQEYRALTLLDKN